MMSPVTDLMLKAEAMCRRYRRWDHNGTFECDSAEHAALEEALDEAFHPGVSPNRDGSVDDGLHARLVSISQLAEGIRRSSP